MSQLGEINLFNFLGKTFIWKTYISIINTQISSLIRQDLFKSQAPELYRSARARCARSFLSDSIFSRNFKAFWWFRTTKAFIKSKSFPEYSINFEEFEGCVVEIFCDLVFLGSNATFRSSLLVFARGFLVKSSWWIVKVRLVFTFSVCGSKFTTFSSSNNFTCVCQSSFSDSSAIDSLSFFLWSGIFESSAFLFRVCLSRLIFYNF